MDLNNHLQKIVQGKNDRVFVIGGSEDDTGKTSISKVFEVNFKKKTLEKRATMQTARVSFAASVSPDGEFIYVAGGTTVWNQVTNKCEVYIVEEDRWEKLADLNQPRTSCSIAVSDTSLYVIGGHSYEPTTKNHLTLKTIELLDLSNPEFAEWEQLKCKLPSKMTTPGCIRADENGVLIFGGWNK